MLSSASRAGVTQRAVGEVLAEPLGDLPASLGSAPEQLGLFWPLRLSGAELQDSGGLLVHGDLAERVGRYRIVP